MLADGSRVPPAKGVVMQPGANPDDPALTTDRSIDAANDLQQDRLL
jgi:hypothetical protein